MRSSALVFIALALVAGRAEARARIAIDTSDVERFYTVYDAAEGRPSAEALQRGYIARGSPGLRDFLPNRIVSGENLAEAIRRDRSRYDRARSCLRVLPKVKARVARALGTLMRVYPRANAAPITLVIGAGNSGGTSGSSGVIVGLEVMCSADWLQPSLDDRLVHLIMHEYGHVQQPAVLNDENAPSTVLRQSLIEGVAELVARITTGEISNAHLQRWTAGRERKIGEAFLQDARSDKLSRWLYNGQGTPSEPGDLGYWIGYAIARSYYDRAPDKRAALAALLTLSDPQAILNESGWTPGYIAP